MGSFRQAEQLSSDESPSVRLLVLVEIYVSSTEHVAVARRLSEETLFQVRLWVSFQDYLFILLI
jgi:hypothetical protein